MPNDRQQALTCIKGVCMVSPGKSGELPTVNPQPPSLLHKRSFWAHPRVITAAIVLACLLIVFNGIAFWWGHRVPWLVAASLVMDMLVVGSGIAFGIRQTLLVEQKTQQAELLSIQAQTSLQQKEARLSAIVDSAMDAIITVNDEQKIVLFNRAAEQVFGISREQAIGRPLERFLPARFREAHRMHVKKFGQTGVTSRRMGDVTKLWAVRSNGDEFPIEASISQVAEGDRRYFTVILRDITLRDRYETELKHQQAELRALSAQVLEAREEEKTRIARELHDELGQLLTALKMDLGWLGGNLTAGDPAVAAKVTQMNETLDRTVGSVRRIAADLRPLMLDDLGLPDAVAWLVEDFSKRSGVHCHFRAPDEKLLSDLDRTVSNTVYRALQESLTNIARHAKAQNAWIVLHIDGESIDLEVEDDGLGITASDVAKVRSFGLKGMRERTLHLGGTLDVARAPRGGTRITLHIPRQPGNGAT
jgi:PAS domain S-box-containing protein